MDTTHAAGSNSDTKSKSDNAGAGGRYFATMLTRRGDLDALELRELDVAAPGPGEVRVRTRVCGAGYTDVIMRRGSYPYAPKFPFVPGYEAVGVVDAVGAGVTSLKVGQRVAALLVWGGYGEFVVRGADQWVPVPDDVDDETACALILNYVTAFQMIERHAGDVAGKTALVTGASGGVGQALIELLRLRGARRVIGACSSARHALVRSLGAEPVEGRTAPVDVGMRAILPEGVDVAFDGIGGATLGACIRATKRGGVVVGYGFTAVVNDTVATLLGFANLFVGSRLRGRRGGFYGITMLYRKDPQPFRTDLPKLFALAAQKKLNPRVSRRLPLKEAREAQRLLEAGGVDGKILLIADASYKEKAPNLRGLLERETGFEPATSSLGS